MPLIQDERAEVMDFRLRVLQKRVNLLCFVMQAFICILVICLSVALFWFGMASSPSAASDPLTTGNTAPLDDQSAGNALLGDNSSLSEKQTTTTSASNSYPRERARSTLLIELPVAARGRSREEALSLQKSYLNLHKDFISSEPFFAHLEKRITGDRKISSLLFSSLEDGLIPINEILPSRLTFALQAVGDKAFPILVVEASGHTREAARQLAALTQNEYWRFSASNKEAHPKILRTTAKLQDARKAHQNLKSDLASYHRLSKDPAQIDQEDELLAQLSSCRTKKRILAEGLREIRQTYKTNPEAIDTLANLKSLAEFENLALMRQKLAQLENLISKYKAVGNPGDYEKISQLEATCRNLRTQVPKEIDLAIETLVVRMRGVLENEFSLTKRLVEAQQNLVGLALRYPKATRLRDAQHSVTNFEEQIQQLDARWIQARKQLRIGDLSSILPPLHLQPRVP